MVSKLHKMNVSGLINPDSLAAALTLQSQSPSPAHSTDNTPRAMPNKKTTLSNPTSFEQSDTMPDAIPLNTTQLKTSQSGQKGASKENAIDECVVFDFKSPNMGVFAPKYLVTMRYKTFYKFWKWFLECCAVIGECAFLWDSGKRSVLGCDLFMDKQDAADLLQKQPMGTFVIRVSHSISGGIILDFCEPDEILDEDDVQNAKSPKKKRVLKHVMLIRKGHKQYELKSHHVR